MGDVEINSEEYGGGLYFPVMFTFMFLPSQPNAVRRDDKLIVVEVDVNLLTEPHLNDENNNVNNNNNNRDTGGEGSSGKSIKGWKTKVVHVSIVFGQMGQEWITELN